MASIRILSEGMKNQRYQLTYEERVVGSNKRKRRSKTFPVGTPLREVKKFKRLKEEEYEKSLGVDLAYLNITMDSLLPEYLEYVEEHMSASTLRTYRQSIYDKNIGISKYFGDRVLKNITTAEIMSYIKVLQQHKTKKGNNMAPKTIINIVYIISSIFDYGKRMNYLERGMDNPCKYVTLPKKEKKEAEVYSLEEIKYILKVLEEEGDLMMLFCYEMAVFSGLRRSEIAGLKFEDFNLMDKTLRISRAKVYGCGVDVIQQTKTQASNRLLAIPDNIVDIVKQVKKYKIRCRNNSNGNYVENDYLYVDKNGNPLKVSSITNNWLKFLDKHPEIRKIGFHKLRHFFCSYLICTGADLKTTMSMMGHSTPDMSLDVYGHAFLENKKDYVNRFADAFYATANS